MRYHTSMYLLVLVSTALRLRGCSAACIIFEAGTNTFTVVKNSFVDIKFSIREDCNVSMILVQNRNGVYCQVFDSMIAHGIDTKCFVSTSGEYTIRVHAGNRWLRTQVFDVKVFLDGRVPEKENVTIYMAAADSENDLQHQPVVYKPTTTAATPTTSTTMTITTAATGGGSAYSGTNSNSNSNSSSSISSSNKDKVSNNSYELSFDNDEIADWTNAVILLVIVYAGAGLNIVFVIFITWRVAEERKERRVSSSGWMSVPIMSKSWKVVGGRHASKTRG
ncbi:uncharacterized protein LOC143296186 isoform X1 [Babylonia areolata]|uniref:uncharacterized protein LOC143296186 isoform X1 n=1 Tax=Babylonia areolata TaxID=304850 RepID=UPI003FD21CD2